MKKNDIISEIIRTTKENGGVPLGRGKFEDETRIKTSEWLGKYWTKWGDALIEAGYEPNIFQEAYDENYLIRKLITLIADDSEFPIVQRIIQKAYEDKEFPSLSTFRSRLGKKHEMARKIVEYCKNNKAHFDVLKICLPICETPHDAEEQEGVKGNKEFGYVYLMKIGKYYKIGMTYDHEERYKQLGRDVPWEKKYVHIIETDDPSGIETYWKKRFEAKRIKQPKKTHKEYFKLSSEDIKAFKRWKRIA